MDVGRTRALLPMLSRAAYQDPQRLREILHPLGPREIAQILLPLYYALSREPYSYKGAVERYTHVSALLQILEEHPDPRVRRAVQEARIVHDWSNTPLLGPALGIYTLHRVLLGDRGKSILNRLKKDRIYLALSHLLGFPYMGRAGTERAARRRFPDLRDAPISTLLYVARYGDEFRDLLGKGDLILHKFPVWPHGAPLEDVVRALGEGGLRVARTAEEHARYLAEFKESCYVPANHLGMTLDYGHTIISGPFLVVALTEKGKGDLEERILARAAIAFLRTPRGLMYALLGVRAKGNGEAAKDYEGRLRASVKRALESMGIREARGSYHRYGLLPGPWERGRTIWYDPTFSVKRVPSARKELSRRVLRDDR